MTALIPLLAALSIAPADSTLWQLTDPAWENPAVKQWMLPQSHSSISGIYTSDRLNRPFDPQLGKGEAFGQVKAQTYLKHKTSTLWGGASYTNGRQYDLVWNETSDPELIYPYFTADSVGGDLKLERYAFSGGYADHTDRWAWGASISYEAGLYYRSVDPRPRNVTGRLDLSVGAAYRVGGQYFAGLSVNYRKYKQTNDIDFKSQTGIDKIYHLTGLGTHYNRFAGTGLSTYYNGNRWGATLNLYPSSGTGLSASLNLSRFSFSKILTDLNKLPLTDTWHNELTAQLAYTGSARKSQWGVAATFNAYRRHGTENIFGDPASSIYPQIYSIEMYADNHRSIALDGAWLWHPTASSEKILLSISPEVAYTHRIQAYASPFRSMLTDDMLYSLRLNFSSAIGSHWRCAVKASTSLRDPVKSRLLLTGVTEPATLTALTAYSYDVVSRSASTYAVGLSAERSVWRSIALRLSADYARTRYALGHRQNAFDVALAVLF